MRKRILFIGPLEGDSEELKRPKYRDRFELEHPDDRFYRRPFFVPGLAFNVLANIDRIVREHRGGRLDGVLGIHDYPAALMSAAIGEALGLPGPSVRSVLTCSHKFYCREAQEQAVPEATPRFGLIDPFRRELGEPPLPYPFFVKPVKGTLSIRARAVHDRQGMEEATRLSWVEKFVAHSVMKPFNEMLDRYTEFERSGDHFIAEELLEGVQVTVDGFVHQGRAEIMGIVDEIMYPGTISFSRFVYPSALPKGVQDRMTEIAKKAILATGFDNSCFNLEMFYDSKRDSIHIIETNCRMSSQFADLYEKVDGTNTYEIQLALATGQRPEFPRGRGRYAVAASLVSRVFEDHKVRRVPSEQELERVHAEFPDTVIQYLCTPGKWLSREPQDMQSFRYLIVNMGAASPEELERSYRRILAVLPDPLASTGTMAESGRGQG
jgi:biotin carboxylase